ncbi:hypothetical protein, partial [Gordonibacter sp.]|uniref:hypothetical protein n=1 Tax=Gordonibacter sp. TaxID=1968902 RepID=UPI002FC5901A
KNAKNAKNGSQHEPHSRSTGFYFSARLWGAVCHGCRRSLPDTAIRIESAVALRFAFLRPS